MGTPKSQNEILESFGDGKDLFKFVSDDDPIQDAIDQFVKQLQKNLDKDKRNASGNLYQSVGGEKDGKWEVTTKNGVTNISLWLPEYWEYTDIGRKPTKNGGSGKVYRNLKGLQGWISQKKLVHSGGEKFLQKWKLKDGTIKKKWVLKTPAESNKIIAFLIARKIHKEGFRNRKTGQNGTKWFTRAVPKFEKDIANSLGLSLSKMKINIEVNGQKWQ